MMKKIIFFCGYILVFFGLSSMERENNASEKKRQDAHQAKAYSIQKKQTLLAYDNLNDSVIVSYKNYIKKIDSNGSATAYFKAHTEPIIFLDYDEPRKSIISIALDGYIKCWDAITLVCTKKYYKPLAKFDKAYLDSNHNFIVVAHKSGNSESKIDILKSQEFELIDTLVVYNLITAVCCTNSCDKVIVGADTGLIKVIDRGTKNVCDIKLDIVKPIIGLHYDKSKNYIIALANRSLYIYDLAHFSLVHKTDFKAKSLTASFYHEPAKLLFIGFAFGTVKALNIENNKIVFNKRENEGSIRAIDFDYRNQHIIVLSKDGAIKFCDVNTTKCVKNVILVTPPNVPDKQKKANKKNEQNSPLDVELINSGQSSDESTSTLCANTNTNSLHKRQKTNPEDDGFKSNDSQRQNSSAQKAITSKDMSIPPESEIKDLGKPLQHDSLILTDVSDSPRSLQAPISFETANSAHNVINNCSAITALCSASKGFVYASANTLIKLFDIANKSFHDLPNLNEKATALIYDSTDNRFGIGSERGMIRWYDINKGLYSYFVAHNSAITKFCYIPQLKRLISGAADGSINIWPSYGPSFALMGHAGKITGLCCNYKRFNIISSSEDGMVKFWNMLDGSCEKAIVCSNGITSLCTDDNGDYIAVSLSNKNVCLLDMSSRYCLYQFADSASYIGRLKLEDINNFEIFGFNDCNLVSISPKGKSELKMHNSPIQAMVFCPSFNCIVTGSADGVLNVWGYTR